MRGSIMRICGFWLAVLAILFACVTAEQDSRASQGKPKGKPKHTNRLAKETSPYLLMHAHNPTDWYPWGPEAFEKAKKEGKLIFLSIGYSSCFWCHVMERESFNNEEVAALLNKWFVCIKVDREERPDIDNIYMTALEVMGRSGGWPLSMFLTAEGKPILGGTYWPREDKVIEGQTFKGFKTMLKAVHEFAQKEPKEVATHADKIAQATAILLAAPPKNIFAPKLDRDLIYAVHEELEASFDKQHGGFGSPVRLFKGPKFPTVSRLEFLWYEGNRTKSKETKEMLDMVTLTLDNMAQGGIYDQLGGGFHRYSTERTWTVPHFEKMLYDNAQLLEIYARAYSATKKPLYQRILQETVEYLKREMLSPEGAFYSSQDAETDEEEGRFYVWTAKELSDAITNPDDLKFFKKVYGAEGQPNFEKKYYILTLPRTLDVVAKDEGMTRDQLLAKLQPLKKKLFEVRDQREKPFLNKIALTSWSGLTIAGLAEAGKALDDAKTIALAKKAAEFVLEKQVTKEGRLLRTYGAQPGKTPRAAVNGYLEDYAFLVHGLLTLHDVTGEKRWLDEAEKLTKTMIQHHGDKDSGGYYFTAHDHEKLFARSKDQFDGATPGGNSMALRNLVRLWIKTGNDFYQKEAQRSFETFAKAIDSQPSGLTTMAQALSMYLDQGKKKVPGKLPDGKLTIPGQETKGTPKLDPVKLEITGGKVDDDGKQTVTVILMVDKGWHTYANPVGNKDLEGADTTVKVKGAKVLKINYPTGKEIESKMVGKYKVYEGKVTITAEVQRAKTANTPPEISVTYQACNDNQCLLPKTVKKTLP